MTFKIDREILKIADYIEKLAFEMKAPNIYTPKFVRLANEIRTAIHTRLAQPEQKREWQGLTYAEMWTLVDEHLKYQLESYEVRVFNLIRAVAEKLEEKNT